MQNGGRKKTGTAINFVHENQYIFEDDVLNCENRKRGECLFGVSGCRVVINQ